jgi:hypothetical protein
MDHAPTETNEQGSITELVRQKKQNKTRSSVDGEGEGGKTERRFKQI